MCVAGRHYLPCNLLLQDRAFEWVEREWRDGKNENGIGTGTRLEKMKQCFTPCITVCITMCEIVSKREYGTSPPRPPKEDDFYF